MLLAGSLMPFAATSLSSLGFLPNVPIDETLLPLAAIAGLSFMGMLVIAGLKK